MTNPKQAQTILDELDAMLHTVEMQSQNKEITHLDLVRITGRVRQHFPDGTPVPVQQALDTSLENCSPQKLAGQNRLRRSVGFAFSLIGAFVFLSGLALTMSSGFITKPVSPPPAAVKGAPQHLWSGIKWLVGFPDQPEPPPEPGKPETHLGGPSRIVFGVAAFVCGLYFLRRVVTQKELCLHAATVLRTELQSWRNSQQPMLGNAQNRDQAS